MTLLIDYFLLLALVFALAAGLFLGFKAIELI
jgi:hypothetical protein